MKRSIHFSFAVLSVAMCILPTFASADVFSFSGSYTPPSAVRVAPSAGKSRISWSAPVGSSPVSYRVYSRLSTEPVLYLIASPASSPFDSQYAYSGVNDAVTRLYAISAIASDGTESFLSDIAMDNDQDGDGLSDSFENSLGTSGTNPDTDGDGLTDGQEQYLYKTNPKLKDTDGNGVDDYRQTIALLTGNKPPLATPDSATVASNATSSLAVLANDSDPDGFLATSTLKIAMAPAHGTATTSNGAVFYISAKNYAGDDSFVYSIEDNLGGISYATTSVTVSAPTMVAVYTAPTFIQVAQSGSTPSTSTSATFSSAVTAGDLIIVGVASPYQGVSVSSGVTDNKGNAYTMKTRSTTANGFMITTWISNGIKTGTSSDPFSISTKLSSSSLVALEYTNVATSAMPVDSASSQVGTSTTLLNTLGFAPAAYPRMGVSFGWSDAGSGAWTIGNDFTSRALVDGSLGATRIAVADMLIPSNATTSPLTVFSIGTSMRWITLLQPIKPFITYVLATSSSQ